MTNKFQSYGLQLFSLLLAIYMINWSVDSPDLEGRFDSQVNEIESVVELIYEVVLDKPNTFSEYDEPDPEQSSIVSNYTVKSIEFDLKPYRFNWVIDTYFDHISDSKYRNPFLPIPTPPPDFSA